MGPHFLDRPLLVACSTGVQYIKTDVCLHIFFILFRSSASDWVTDSEKKTGTETNKHSCCLHYLLKKIIIHFRVI